jgi:hypothetical protein
MFQSLRSPLFAWIVSLLLAITCMRVSAQMNGPDRVSSASQESRQSKIARPLRGASECDQRRHGR